MLTRSFCSIEDLQKDEEYREVVLTARIDFIAPEDLFGMLRWRFSEAEQDSLRHPQDKMETQYKYVQVCKRHSVPTMSLNAALTNPGCQRPHGSAVLDIASASARG